MPRSNRPGRSFTGLKDKKIKLFGITHKKTKGGFSEEFFYDLCDPVWANYRSISGDEYYSCKQTGYDENAIFTINWRNDVKEGMCLLYHEEVYKIVYIDRLEGYKKDLKLHCETSKSTSVKALNEKLIPRENVTIGEEE